MTNNKIKPKITLEKAAAGSGQYAYRIVRMENVVTVNLYPRTSGTKRIGDVMSEADLESITRDFAIVIKQ